MTQTSEIVAEYHGIRIPSAPHFGPNMIVAMNEGRYEGKEVKSALACVKPGARVLELGSGSGIVGAIIAKNCKPEFVVSIEANPNLIEHVNGLYQENNLEKTISVRHAIVLSDPNGPAEVDFFIRGNFLGSGMTVLNKVHKATKVSVKTLQYSDLNKDYKFDTLIMDIEGAELDFLRHADLTGVDLFIAEMHRNIYGREGMQEIRALLTAGGLVMDREQSFSGVHIYHRA